MGMVLHYLAYSCTILHFLALSCTILHYLALSCTNWHYLALSCTILHYLTLSCTILHFLALSCTILPYVIFVIFFTRAKFLDNKIYTEKRQFFALNPYKNATFSGKICRKCQFFGLNL